MFNKDKQKAASQSIFVGSAQGLANTIAVAVTFFGAGPLYSSTVKFIEEYAYSSYGTFMGDISSFGWFLICVFFTFFITRMSLSTAIMMGAMTVAARAF